VPSEFYVKEITEKLDIDESIVQMTLSDKRYVQEVLQAFYLLNDDDIKRLRVVLSPVEHNVAINLCKLAILVYLDEPDENQYVMMLEHVVTTMTDLEVELYLFAAATYFTHRQKYKTALELITLYDTMTPMDESLDAMMHELAYQVRMRLGFPVLASLNYHQAMMHFQRHHNTYRMTRLALMRLSHLAKEDPDGTVQRMRSMAVNRMRPLDRDHYHYIMAQALHAAGRDSDATLELKRIAAESRFAYRKTLLLYEICIEQGDHEMREKLEELLDETNPHPSEMAAKIEYHLWKQPNDEDQKQYLREIAIPFSIRTENPQLTWTYVQKIMDLCIAHARYKEATQYLQKWNKEMQRIKDLQ
jgi:hypothetical protein